MDVRGARKFHLASRYLVLIIPLLVVLVVSIIWNVRQYRLIEYERQRSLATEREKAERDATELARTQARREKKAEEAAANQRMQELYREIDNLGQISDRLLTQPVRQPKSPSMISRLEAADGPP
jgi:uncharacterized membrane protein YcjF (UPF0283 family)